MKALTIHRRPEVGGLCRVIRLQEMPRPEPGPEQVRVRVCAAAINVDDQHIAEGSMFGGFPIAPRPTNTRPWVPGTEFAGLIDALGQGVEGFDLGQSVFGMRPPKLPGPWAEYCVVGADFVAPKPDNWTMREAAALCLSGTVLACVLARVDSLAGKHCLVVGASGSLGSMLVQLLSRAGARVWGVCSGANRKMVERLGAERVIDYHEADFGAQLCDLRVLVDHTFDFVGGADTQRQGLAVTRKRGSFVTVVGPVKYVGQEKLGIARLVAMLVRIGWSLLWSRIRGPRYHFVGPLRPDFDAIKRLMIEPEVRPVIDHVVEFAQQPARDAIAYVASHRAKGKVLLEMVGPRASA